MGHYASSCGQTQGGGGGQTNRGGQGGGNNYGSFNFGAANNNYTPSNNNRAMSNITNTGGGNTKVCPQCGYQGARHPRGSNCPSIKRKQVKKNGAGDGGFAEEYGGGDDY